MAKKAKKEKKSPEAAGGSTLIVNTYPLDGTENFTVPRVKFRKRRVWELDFLRGLAILLVLFDHTMIDAAYIFGKEWVASGNAFLTNFTFFAHDYLDSGLRLFWRPFFIFLFFFVSGICTGFSRNNLTRSLKMILAAGFVTGATAITDFVIGLEGTFILFGVIQCFAVTVAFYALCELLIYKPFKNKKAAKYIFSAFCLAVGAIILILNAKFNVTLNQYESAYDVNYIETNGGLAGLFVYAEPSSPIITADYFPLMPYMGYFFLGAGLTSFIYPRKKSLLPFLDGKWHYPVTVPGRFSLIIYLAWQVVAFIVLGLLSLALINTTVLF